MARKPGKNDRRVTGSLPRRQADSEMIQIAGLLTSLGYGKDKGAYVTKWGRGWAVYVVDRVKDRQDAEAEEQT